MVTQQGPAGARNRRSGRKLAEQVALQIEDDIRAAGWPLGMNLGSENDLLARYGASRAVVREAVGLCEYLGVARMRRGPGGGLIVTEPDPSAVVTAVVVYLAFRQVRLEDILELRRPLEDTAARLAAERATRSDIERLRERVEIERSSTRWDPWVFYDLVAAASGNPVLDLFVQILTRVTVQYRGMAKVAPRGAAVYTDLAAAHTRILAGIEAGDPEQASRRMMRHMDALSAFFSSRQLDRRLSLGDGMARSVGQKLAASIARRLFTDIVDRGWPVGELLGSEPDLIRRYDVSRAVLREANRLLEFHRVLRTQRGVGGGVFISAPDEEATTDALAVYLESRSVTAQQLFEVREAIEVASVELAATRLDKAAIGVLTEALADEMGSPATSIGTSAHALHLRIAELTGNPAMLLLLHALTRLTEHHVVHPDEGFPMSYEEAAAAVGRAHARIVTAIAAGDAEAAKRRMLRHLRAVPTLLN